MEKCYFARCDLLVCSKEILDVLIFDEKLLVCSMGNYYVLNWTSLVCSMGNYGCTYCNGSEQYTQCQTSSDLDALQSTFPNEFDV